MTNTPTDFFGEGVQWPELGGGLVILSAAGDTTQVVRITLLDLDHKRRSAILSPTQARDIAHHLNLLADRVDLQS